jgi:hypothetical protein
MSSIKSVSPEIHTVFENTPISGHIEFNRVISSGTLFISTTNQCIRVDINSPTTSLDITMISPKCGDHRVKIWILGEDKFFGDYVTIKKNL